MRVLVTGGAGFIGSHIVDQLLADGQRLLVVDDFSSGKLANVPAGVDVARLDVRDPELAAVVGAFRPDLITHCAARASVPASVADPFEDANVNILGGINVCRAAVASECRQCIYITTGGALYGEPVYLPCDEQHPIQPLSPYGLSKWTLECYLRLLLPPAIPLKVLRLANVYGPRQDPEGEGGVVSIFGAQMLKGDRVTIFGDGLQTRDLVYVGDVVEAHALALEASGSFTLNISSGAPLTVIDLFRRMASLAAYERTPVYEPERPGDIRHSVLANTAAQRLLGWAPATGIDDGLRQTLAWLRRREGAGQASR